MKKWKCGNCGYVAEGEMPPRECPNCGHDMSEFTLVEDEAE